MLKCTRPIWIFACCAAMGMLILDSGCAARSAASAVELCLSTLIPSLFPMLVLSGWLASRISGLRLPWLARLLRVPDGSEGLFLLGLLGGYPAGCAAIVQNVRSGSLSSGDGERMLGFCSNCAPAFLFGVLGAVLGDLRQVFAIAVIQLLCAALAAAHWPGAPEQQAAAPARPVTLPQAVRQSVAALGSICAWVVLSGVVTGFCQKWLFPLLPDVVSPVLTGLLELTSGCVTLPRVHGAELRFLLACVLVNFGGICVLLQLQALAAPAGISLRACAAQKLCQSALALGLGFLWLRAGAWAFAAGALPLLKKAVEISRPMVYNTPSKGGI